MSSIKSRDPYFIQIGFDFGTCYSKCVCRDVFKDNAWVHIPSGQKSSELPFLIPSGLKFERGILSRITDQKHQYVQNGLARLKVAIERAASGDWNAEVLQPFRQALQIEDNDSLADFLKICGIFYLGAVIGDVRQQIKRRFSDFGANSLDFLAINLAVPVADAERPRVSEIYESILHRAWILADRLAGKERIALTDLVKMISDASVDEQVCEACVIYPEVSANVQGFVRSRVSQPGIYLFSDTGAGTVDQSVFIFHRPNGTERLTYLHGSVSPLGSSYIEFTAAKLAGRLDFDELECWRRRKERGGSYPELRAAREQIEDQLAQDSSNTIANAKAKLISPQQINDLKLIFGGGGHSEHPYKNAVVRPFHGPYFRRGFDPDSVGVPAPSDLDLAPANRRWMPRLTVAYGLSFDKTQLASFIYPRGVEPPKPDELWRPRHTAAHAPDKDET